MFPLRSITQPEASTIGIVAAMGVVETAVGCGTGVVFAKFPAFGLNLTHADTVLESCNGSVGLMGSPPRPVATNVFWNCRVPGVQAVEICLEASTRLIGSSTKPRVGSISGVVICTLPLNSRVAPVAVMSLVFWEAISRN